MERERRETGREGRGKSKEYIFRDRVSEIGELAKEVLSAVPC